MSRTEGWRVKVNDLINDPKSSYLGAFIYCSLMGLVLLSAIVLCLGTLEEFKDNSSIETIEWICACVFSIELFLRVVSWQEKWYTMLLSGTLYIDVLSVAPFFIVKGIEMSSTLVEVSSGDEGEENNGLQIIGILRSAPVKTWEWADTLPLVAVPQRGRGRPPYHPHHPYHHPGCRPRPPPGLSD